MIGAPQGIFHITQHGIDPVKCRVLGTVGTAADTMHCVLATRIGEGVKTCSPSLTTVVPGRRWC
jgi:hypothetical protein